MKFTQKLLKHPEFQRIQQEISIWEQDRVYCRHELSHALDVCRMAWIIFLEHTHANGQSLENMEELKVRIYVTGLLHDIGRSCQYQTGEHHSDAGARIARKILQELDYPYEWTEETIQAVGAHHGKLEERQMRWQEFEGKAVCHSFHSAELSGQLTDLIQCADHLSRNCFCCPASEGCKWSAQEKNRTIRY